MSDIKTNDEIITRLRKIEGQIRGLQKMIIEEKNCKDVLYQLVAARRALDKVGVLILSNRLQNCLCGQNDQLPEKTIKETAELFMSLK
ncbi:MAG: metal-sensitive transcriptional regulator [Armatimonadota bacterium]